MPELNDKKLLISVAASVPTEYIERRLRGKVPVIRAMPNTPSMVGEGITAICAGKYRRAEGRRDGARSFSTRWAERWWWTKKHGCGDRACRRAGRRLFTLFWNRWRKAA